MLFYKAGQLMQNFKIKAGICAVFSWIINDKRHRVQAEAVKAPVEPKSQDTFSLAYNERVLIVQIGFKMIKTVKKILVGNGIKTPGLFFNNRKPHAFIPVLGLHF